MTGLSFQTGNPLKSDAGWTLENRLIYFRSRQTGGHHSQRTIDDSLHPKILWAELGEPFAHPRDDEADGPFVGDDDADVLFAGGAASSYPGGGGDPEVGGGVGEGGTDKGRRRDERQPIQLTQEPSQVVPVPFCPLQKTQYLAQITWNDGQRRASDFFSFAAFQDTVNVPSPGVYLRIRSVEWVISKKVNVKESPATIPNSGAGLTCRSR